MCSKKGKIDNEKEARCVGILAELEKLEAGHGERMERWEELNQSCLTLAGEISTAANAGVPSQQVYKMRQSLKQAQQERDKEKWEADKKRMKLYNELEILNGDEVNNAYDKLNSALKRTEEEHVRDPLERVPSGMYGHRTKIVLSNDRAFSQIVKLVTDGRNRLSKIRNHALPSQIREVLRKTLEEIEGVSMEPERINIEGGFFNTLDKEPSILASPTETHRAKNLAKLVEIDRHLEAWKDSMKKEKGR